MRLLATSLLLFMTALFIATSFALKQTPWLAYVRAFAEAGMVGACADWFAVVALFRKPLGLPIPHTGIIPANKQRIGDALGQFIATHFLARAVLSKKLERLDLTRWGAGWLRDRGHGERAGRQLQSILPRITRMLPREQTADLLALISRSGLEALPAAPVASKVLAILWAQNETQLLIDRGIELAQASLVKRQGLIRQKIAENSSRFVPKWVDGKLAEKVMTGLVSTLDDMRSPTHPWRTELRNAVEKLVAGLAHDPAFYARGEQIKSDILGNRLVRDQIQRLCLELEERVRTGVDARPEAIVTSVEVTFETLGQWLDQNEAIQKRIDLWVRRLVLELLLPRREAIGDFISQVVRDWDTASLTSRLELQIGRDMQYIRINGTLVGGCTGLAIYSVSHWFGVV